MQSNAIMETCRLCLYSGGEVKILSIFDAQHGNLSEKIEECVSLKIQKGDKIAHICASCINQLNQWEHFKDCCHRSNEILQQNEANEKTHSRDEYMDVYDSSDLMTNNDEAIQEESEDEELPATNSKSTKELEELLKDHFEDGHSKINSNIYSCEICNENFYDCLDYLDHQGKHDGNPVFNCSKCTEVFTTRKDLVQHDSNHKSPCHQCGKMISKSSMKLHLNRHTDKYKCTECSGRFNSRAGLTQHVITVHTDIKDHICETCGKRFSSQTSMRVHRKSHSDERMYPCKKCSYAGRTASALYIHMSTHANDLCVCEICSKTFKSTRNLNDHLRRFHCKNKKHECTYCMKRFVDRYILRVHMRCHTGVRPYKCTKCDKSFIRSDGLKEHMLTHGQRVLFDCAECGKKFTSKRGFTRHVCTGVL